MFTITLACLSIVLFFWSGLEILVERLAERDRVKGLESKGMMHALSTLYSATQGASREEAFHYLIQAGLFFLWLFFSTIAWATMSIEGALWVTIGLLILTLGVPRVWTLRQARAFETKVASEIPLVTFMFVLALNKTKNILTPLGNLIDSSEYDLLDSRVLSALKRIETRIGHNMKADYAINRFAEEMKVESAANFSKVMEGYLATNETNEGMIRLVSREQELVYQSEEGLIGYIYFGLGCFILATVVLSSILLIYPN